MWMLRSFLRFLQATCCLIALITASSGFVTTSSRGFTTMLGSNPVTYTQLITFMGFLYALFVLLLVELMEEVTHPFWLAEVISDFVMAVFLLVAAIALLCCDYVQHCNIYGVMLRCRSLNTAVVFTFISMALFFLSLLVLVFSGHADRDNMSSSMETDRGNQHRTQCHVTETPTTHDSPKNPTDRIGALDAAV